MKPLGKLAATSGGTAAFCASIILSGVVSGRSFRYLRLSVGHGEHKLDVYIAQMAVPRFQTLATLLALHYRSLYRF